ncbi:MAG: DUF4202 domain-containing protein [Planctomycetes bacterium]|jgi:aspartokinase|nr:DUF4202 domain-containing protein [Planctomycetota bacterium]
MTSLYQKTEEFVNKVTGGSRHLERTVYWLKELKPDANELMQIAALSHDIERAFRDKNYDKVSANDKGYQSDEHLSHHQQKGAEIMAQFLKEQGASEEVINKVYSLILKHEVGGDEDQNLIKDADSLSFLENNIEIFLTEQIKKMGYEKVLNKFNWMFERITNIKARKIAQPWYDEAIKKLKFLNENGTSYE